MYHECFGMLARYNRWANDRLYDAVGSLPAAQRDADLGLFFGSLHATLNHILAADRIWLKRFTGDGEAPDRLDAVLFEEFEALRNARIAEDRRICDWIDALDEAAFLRAFSYRPITDPRDLVEPLAPALFHLFNHQTHHRGQCHAGLTTMGRPSVVLDMIAFQRQSREEAQA